MGGATEESWAASLHSCDTLWASPGASKFSTGAHGSKDRSELSQQSSLPYPGSPSPHLKNQIPREAWALNIH